MRVLHVVHRVVHGLSRDRLDVEVERGVRRAGDERVPGGVGAHLVQELVEHHVVARAPAHANRLTAAIQRDQLMDEDLDAGRVDA